MTASPRPLTSTLWLLKAWVDLNQAGLLLFLISVVATGSLKENPFFYSVPCFYQLYPRFPFQLYLKETASMQRREGKVCICYGGAKESFIKESFLLYSQFTLLKCQHFSPGSGFYQPHSLKTDANWQWFCSFLLVKFHVLLPAICHILYEFCLSVNATC